MSKPFPGPALEDAPLAHRTTLGVGGPARWLAAAHGPAELTAWLAWARAQGVPTLVLGGGSNLLVSDAGFDGLVLSVEDDALDLERVGDVVVARVGAGVAWDDLVARVVAEGLAGLECLSGIPGRVGAAPIQNIGAYGQEVGEVVQAVHVVDRASGERTRIAAAECGFGYRWSAFKGAWKDRFVVAQVDLALRPGGAPALRYPELQRALGWAEGAASPPLGEVRAAVIGVRRGKSMVLDPADDNRRSAGSFFMNPIVTLAQAEAVRRAVAEAGLDPATLPAYPCDPGEVKLSAAWLIERAGFPRGFTHGAAGLSTRHTLALVNRGQARAADLVALAALIRAGVRERFGVTLHPEPVFVGFDREVDALLG